MAKEIVVDSSQDEVCVEIWDVLQAVKTRTLNYIANGVHTDDFSREMSDMLFLMERSGEVYRRHAERRPAPWVLESAGEDYSDLLQVNWFSPVTEKNKLPY